MRPKILLLGNRSLREESAAVSDFKSEEIQNEIALLKETLDAFRKEKGFGRGIAAPQIGIKKQIIALNIGEGTFAIVNPKIIRQSSEVFTMWDDCMSFPDLLVKLVRNRSVAIAYQDESGADKSWREITQAGSELLQHEIDHLHGVLAIDRVTDMRDIIYRAEYERNRQFYAEKVDYVISSTIR